MKVLVLFMMLFCHIVDDYYLQGVLASMKQRNWWNDKPEQYKSDYLMALVEHAFSWTFMTLLPIMVYMIYYKHINVIFYIIAFVMNWIIHIFTDNAKANKGAINLIQDQYIHFVQILVTWTNFFIVFVMMEVK